MTPLRRTPKFAVLAVLGQRPYVLNNLQHYQLSTIYR